MPVTGSEWPAWLTELRALRALSGAGIAWARPAAKATRAARPGARARRAPERRRVGTATATLRPDGAPRTMDLCVDAGPPAQVFVALSPDGERLPECFQVAGGTTPESLALALGPYAAPATAALRRTRSCRFAHGVVTDFAAEVENRCATSPFAEPTPLALALPLRADAPVLRCAFRTRYSDSWIVFDGYPWLNQTFATGAYPVVGTIHYEPVAHPSVAATFNAHYGKRFPADVPADALGLAAVGLALSAEQVYAQAEAAATGYDAATGFVLGAVASEASPGFAADLQRFSRHREQAVRQLVLILAEARAAAQIRDGAAPDTLDLIRAMAEAEKGSPMRAFAARMLRGLEALGRAPT